MKLIILKYFDKVMNKYHPEGGLLVIAKNIDDAKEVVSINKDIEVTDHTLLNSICYDLKKK